jgi:hypothetical protein
MYINLGNICRYTCYNVGVYFSDTIIVGLPNNLLPFTPQINNVVGNIPDTLSWTLVSGNFTSHAEKNIL